MTHRPFDEWDLGGWRRDLRMRQPAPTDGMPASGSSATWWGQAWIAVLMAKGAGASESSAGASYARQGRVVDIEVQPGCVTAGVVGSSPRAHRVSITVAPISKDRRSFLVKQLRARAGHLADLLAGRLPSDLTERVRNDLVGLAPGDVVAECECRGRPRPCRHWVALHLVVAEAMDRDPWLLFVLRGMERGDLTKQLGIDLAPTQRPMLQVDRREDGAHSPRGGHDAPREGTVDFARPGEARALLEILGDLPAGADQGAGRAALLALYESARERALKLVLAGRPGESAPARETGFRETGRRSRPPSRAESLARELGIGGPEAALWSDKT